MKLQAGASCLSFAMTTFCRLLHHLLLFETGAVCALGRISAVIDHFTALTQVKQLTLDCGFT